MLKLEYGMILDDVESVGLSAEQRANILKWFQEEVNRIEREMLGAGRIIMHQLPWHSGSIYGWHSRD